MTKQRVTLITLGVADLAKSRAFYARLGWQEHGESQDTVVFFQMQGAVLGLFPLSDLAKDQGRPDAVLGTGAVTLAQNFATDAEVDAAFEETWRLLEMRVRAFLAPDRAALDKHALQAALADIGAMEGAA